VAVRLVESLGKPHQLSVPKKNERSDQLIVQNATPHIDAKSVLKISFHRGMGINFRPNV
jgi:hypothetical protein